jgi:hypothetical protein
MITVDTKQVADIAKRFNYRKKKVSVCATKSVTLCDLNWSGGTKSEYHAVGLNSGKIVSPKLDGPAPWDNRTEGATIALPVDVIIVRTGWFCGKPSTMTIYVRPENMPALIGEQANANAQA